MILLACLSIDMYAQGGRWLRNASIGRVYTTENLGDNYQSLQQARVNIQMLDFERALLHLDNAIAEHPGSAEAYVLRANLKQRLGMLSDARNDMMIASRLNPYAANIYGYNGQNGLMKEFDINPQAYMEYPGVDERMAFYMDELMGMDTASTLDALDYERILEATVLMENEEWTVAEELLDSVLVAHPSSFIVNDLLGVIQLEQGEYELAFSYLNKAVNLNPNFSIAWYNLGRLEQRRNNKDKAKKYYDHAIELEQGLTKAYFDRAMLHKSLGEVRKAISDYDTIINNNDEDKWSEAYMNRGLAKKTLGDFTGALNDLEMAIEQDPDNPYVYKNRANLYVVFGMHWEALQDYSKAIEIKEDFAEAYFNRALVRIILLDSTAACEDLRKSEHLGYLKANDYMQYFCID